MSEGERTEPISAQRLASIRALVHAGRYVANSETRVLLEAYDELKVRLSAMPAGLAPRNS